jgi:2-amino-4-hydroxy-6-hydroxymethyldihydropteridine diphosphokinase
VRQSVDLPAVLALGSNLGDRGALLEAAIEDISRTPGISLLKRSNIIETPALKPDGIDLAAPPYLNAVVTVRTTLMPEHLLAAVNAIETAHGRVRAERWGDRTLDIDIITIGPMRIATDSLTVPHPRAHERDFVLRPWLEVEPEATLPDHGRIDQLLARMETAV